MSGLKTQALRCADTPKQSICTKKYAEVGLIERNLAVMAVIDATRDIAKCPLMAADVAAGIREFDTPDMDFVGRCRKAALFLSQIEKELNA